MLPRKKFPEIDDTEIANDNDWITKERLIAIGKNPDELLPEAIAIIIAMSQAKFSVLLPILRWSIPSLEELQMFALEDTRILKGHVKRILEAWSKKKGKKTKSRALVPITQVEVSIEETIIQSLIPHLTKTEIDTFEDTLLSGKVDAENMQTLLIIPPAKLALMWEYVAELRNDQIAAIALLQDDTIIRHIDGCIWMDVTKIQQLEKTSFSKRVQNVIWNVRRNVSSRLEEPIWDIERLSKSAWNTLKNSFNLRISKHTFEWVLHYVGKWESVERTRDESSSFYTAFTHLVENGKLSQILKYLKQPLNSDFLKRSRKWGQRLAEQLLSLVWGKKLVPKEAII